MKGFLFCSLAFLLFFMSQSQAATWTLTNLSSTWQGQTYWQFPLNQTAGAINSYHLQLQAGSVTPGTISVFSNANNYYLPNVYISTNCSTVISCPSANFTSLPTSEHNCWNANSGNTSMWQMNVGTTSSSCDIYLGIISNPNNVTVNFAYLPEFQISSNQNYSNIPVYWIATGEQFYTYSLPSIYANTTGATFTVNFRSIATSVVTSMYIGSNDTSFQLSPCNYTFPAKNQTCARSQNPYTSQGASYYSYTTYLNSALSTMILGFVTGQNGTQQSFSLESSVTMVCKQGYIQQGKACILQNSSSLTNASSTLQPSNQRYWNISLVPASVGEQLIYSLSLANSDLPGTFYLNSQSTLPAAYISTDCNSTTICQNPTITPSPTSYCFTQSSGATTFQMNNLLPQYPNVTTGCSYYFTFPNGGTQMNVQAEYFPIQNISDYSQLQYYYIPWATASMPRYFIYELPYKYRTITPSRLQSFTVQISDVDENLIQNVYLSTNDPSASSSCQFTPFPNNQTNCSMLSSVKINSTGNFYTYTFHLQSYSSLNYLAFYVEQNNSISYLNATISSKVNCNTNYSYSEDVGDCVQIVNVPLTQNFTQYGNSRYWNVQPPVQAGMINIYSLNLESTDQSGTFYVGTTQGKQMPNLYISSNCSTSCSTYTSTPTSTSQCWNTSSFTKQLLTTYINVNPSPKQFCSTYFSLENATGSEVLIIAYFPASFAIQPGTQNQTLLFPWQNYPAPRYIIPVMNYTMSQATFSSKFQFYSIDLLNISQTPFLKNDAIYLSSKDPYICDGNWTSLFPGPSAGCGVVLSRATINGTTVDNCQYNQEYYTNGVQMAIYGQSSQADPQLTFQYNTVFHCVSPAQLINGTCQIYSSPNVTSVTGQVTNSTTGNYWNLSLQATGQPQLFQLDLTSNNIPGAFYWSQNQIYPTIYAITNCSSSCTYNSSLDASSTNYCATNPIGTATAWSMNTDAAINTGSCYVQFYLQANITTNYTFQFMYYPEKILSDGNNTAIFNWSPLLFRYFKYSFSTTYQSIPFAQFRFTLSTPLTTPINAIYFGTTDPNSFCNYSLPSSTSKCQDVLVTTTNNSNNYQLVINNPNSTIYLAISSNSASITTFTITPSFTCFTGYYQPTGQMTCKVKGSCNAGQYYDETQNQCIACSTALSNCALCTSSTTCTECTNNQFTLAGGKCVAVCPSGEYPNPAPTSTTGICLPCMAHCIQCTTNTDCQECYEPTYIWSATNKNCSTVCPAGGQYYDQQTKQCINCEVQYCIVCYGAGKQCNGCQDGYQPVQLQNGNIECQKIQPKPKSAQFLQINLFTIILFALILLFKN